MKESKVNQEFQEEARVEGARQFILDALEIKFGPPAAKEFAPALDTITDSGRLAGVNRIAWRCAAPPWTNFGTALRNGQGGLSERDDRRHPPARSAKAIPMATLAATATAQPLYLVTSIV
jgi:hypothetical protein